MKQFDNTLSRETPDLTQAALVIIDIQNDYFPGGKREMFNAVPASQVARDILQYFRNHALPVIHVYHESLAPSPSFFEPGSEGARIHPNVQPLPNETVILKHQRSSFAETSLLDILKKLNIVRLIICGMQTNCCVQATTEDALRFGFEVTLIADAIAAVDAETHLQTLELLKGEHVQVINHTCFPCQ